MTRKGTWSIVLIGLLLIGVACHAQVQTSSQIVTPPVETPSASAPLIVVFYEDGCHSCEQMEGLLDELLVGYEDVPVARHEINAPGSSALLWKLAAHYGIVATQVPVIFIGDQAIVGAGRAQEFNLRTAVGDCVQLGCPSPLDYVEGGKVILHDLLIAGAFVGLFIALLILQGL